MVTKKLVLVGSFWGGQPVNLLKSVLPWMGLMFVDNYTQAGDFGQTINSREFKIAFLFCEREKAIKPHDLLVLVR
jgi:hypothetical protein